MKLVIGTVVITVLYIIAQWICRGYFSFGAEILLPVLAFIIYTMKTDRKKKKEKEDEYERW